MASLYCVLHLLWFHTAAVIVAHRAEMKNPGALIFMMDTREVGGPGGTRTPNLTVMSGQL